MTILVIENNRIRCLSHCNKLPQNSNLVAVPSNTPLHKVPFFITEPSEYAKEVYRILYK